MFSKFKQVKELNDSGVYVGDITHYFSKIKVVVLKIKQGRLLVGDMIQMRGVTTNFKQKVVSLQIESVDVKVAKKGKLVGLQVKKGARVGDKVYKC